MELENNPYSLMQKEFYDATYLQMGGNHSEHNENPDYWELILLDMRNDPERWRDKRALDFGCGQGRNVIHMLRSAPFFKVDGVDISEKNIEMCLSNLKKEFPGKAVRFFVNDGWDLFPIGSDIYDLVTSTIVLQHICVHAIRFNLMKEIYRVLKPGGIFSFQMGFGGSHPNTVGYFEDKWDAEGTNSHCDVRIDNPEDLTNELRKIGFDSVTSVVKSSRGLDRHGEWIFVTCVKP
jgi:SAM-dependent methyltransferase